MADFWSTIFGGQPTSVFDTYANTSNVLDTLRKNKIANALSQIKLNYAPQMAQQGADLGAANVSIKQNEAKYAPQMSLADLAQKYAQTKYTQAETVRTYAASKGEQLDNVIKQAKANHANESVINDLQIQRAKIGLLHAQASQASSKAQALGVGTKKAAPYLDLSGNPIADPYQQTNNSGIVSPSQAPSQNSAPSAGINAAPVIPQSSQGAPATLATPDNSDNTLPPSTPSPQMPSSLSQGASPSQPSQVPQATFPGANPNAPNILAPVGPPDSRGHAGAYMNPHTGEHFTVLSTTGREKMRNQLVALRQAAPYIDDLIKYGTVGAIGPSGKNELLPNWAGGVPRAVGANYDKALAAASEHVMVGSQMQKTDKTTDMINTILNRQNFEPADAYTNRMRTFQQHLNALEADTKNALNINMMSLDRSALAKNYIESEYNKIKNPDKVIMIDIKTGKKGYVPKEDVKEALASKQYRMAQ